MFASSPTLPPPKMVRLGVVIRNWQPVDDMSPTLTSVEDDARLRWRIGSPDRVRGNGSCLVAKGLVIVEHPATPGTLTITA